MTVLLYTRRKEWPLESVTVESTHERVERSAYPDYGEGDQPWIDLISMHITLKGDLDQAQQERVRYIAGRCPVYRTLRNAPMIVEKVEVVR